MMQRRGEIQKLAPMQCDRTAAAAGRYEIIAPLLERDLDRYGRMA